MKRKLVRQGVASATISLPSSWVKKFNLKMGDEVSVEEKDNLIIVSPENTYVPESREININNLHPLRSTLMKLYQEGYDEIKIKASDPSQINTVRGVISELLGFEIVEEKKSSCILRRITGEPIEDFDNLYRRIFFLLRDIIKDGYSALKENDESLLLNLIGRDTEINRFTNICLRELNKGGYKEFKKTPVMYSLILKLEEISDGFKSLYETVLRENLKLTPKQLTLYKEVQDLLDKCYEFCFDLTKQNGSAVANRYAKTTKKLDNSLLKSNGIEIKILSQLLSLCDKILPLQGLQLAHIKDI